MKTPSIKNQTFPQEFIAYKKDIYKNKEVFDEKIKHLSNSIKEIDNLPLIQSELYVVLHDINEEILNMEFALIKIEHTLDNYKKKLLIFYKTKSDISLNSFSEITTVLNSDCSPYLTSQKIIQSYLDYLNESRKILNSLTFAIKNRIELYKMNDY